MLCPGLWFQIYEIYFRILKSPLTILLPESIVFSMKTSELPYSQIAKKAGVSPATISRALRSPQLVKPETRQKIYQAITALGGTLPEGTPAATSDPMILVIVPVLNNPFYTDIVQGIQSGAHQNHCQVIIINESVSAYNIQYILHLISTLGVSGVILMEQIDRQILRELSSHTAVVQCCEYNEEEEVTYITINHKEATRKLLRHIISTGRTRIALVNSDPSRYIYAKLRLQAFLETMEKAGVKPDPAHIVTIPDGTFSQALPAISAMLKNAPVPEAIFCVSDILAAAALRSCSVEGYKVPDDILVAGFDNVDISIMTTPNITTVSQPRHSIGVLACSQLLSMIRNPHKDPQHFVLDTELVIRESTTF